MFLTGKLTLTSTTNGSTTNASLRVAVQIQWHQLHLDSTAQQILGSPTIGERRGP